MTKKNLDTIEINWEIYVKKSSIKTTNKAISLKWMPYVMLRTQSAWVFCWYLKKREWKEAELLQARRIRYRDWASSLSELAQRGTSKPENCKFPCEVDSIELTEVIEVLSMTEEARLSIKNVAIWTK